MAETSFDVLSQFSDPGNKSVTLKFPEQSSNNVTFANTTTTSTATPVNVNDIYNNSSQQYMDAMSDYYAGTYLPISEAKKANIEQAKAELGFGTRYKASDFKADIERQFGEIPKASNAEKAFNMLFDMLTKKSNYRGAAAVFDVGIQSMGAQMDRDKLEKAKQIEQQLLISEMAIKQANEMNQIMLSKEAELTLKGMGYTEDMLSEMMNYSGDVRLKIFDADIAKDKSIFDNRLDKEKMFYEHSLLMLRNPEKSFPTLMYKEKDSDEVKTVPVQLKPNPVDGSPMYMLGRRVTTDQGSFDLFDQPVPEDWSVVGIYTGDQPGTQAAALSKPFGAAQLSDIGRDYFVYTQAVDTFDTILKENAERIALGQDPTLGTAGFINDLLQKTKFATVEFFNTITGTEGVAGTLGTDIQKLGENAYRDDLANLKLANQGEFDINKVPDFDSEIDITYRVQGGLEKATGLPLKDKTITKKTKLSDLFNQQFYELTLGYDPVFARNKVRENYLVYAIARALKPSGRLNVNDVEAAREILTVTSPFSSSAEVVAKIGTIKDLLNTSAQNLVKSTFIDGKSVLDINPALKDDYNTRYGDLIIAGQEPVVSQGGSSTDNSVGGQNNDSSIVTDSEVPEFNINVIGSN